MDSKPVERLIAASGAYSALNNRRRAACEVIIHQLVKRSAYLAPTYTIYVRKKSPVLSLTAGKLQRKLLVIHVRGVLRKTSLKASGVLPVIFGAL